MQTCIHLSDVTPSLFLLALFVRCGGDSFIVVWYALLHPERIRFTSGVFPPRSFHSLWRRLLHCCLVCITPSIKNPLHFRSFSSSLISFAVAETPSVLRISLWKGWSNTYPTVIKRRTSCRSEQCERSGVTGVGGTSVYGVVFKVVAKYKLLIMWNLRFATHGFSTR